MNLYVVRHGQTDWNILKKMQGSADIPLNKTGIEQAYITRENLKNINFDLIYSSTLTRAKQTAKIINEDRKIDIIYTEKLLERNYGEFEGTSKNSFDYNEFWSYNKNVFYNKAENIQIFFKRIYDFLDCLKNEHPTKNILIVTHAGVIKAIECYSNGMMKDEEIGPFLPSNCDVLKYKI